MKLCSTYGRHVDNVAFPKAKHQQQAEKIKKKKNSQRLHIKCKRQQAFVALF